MWFLFLTLTLGNATLEVSPKVLPPIPFQYTREETGSLNYAALAADRGNAYWGYLRETQSRIEWRALEVFPDDLEGDWIWPSGLVLYQGGTPCQVRLASRCGVAWQECEAVVPPFNRSFRSLLTTFPRTSPRIVGYVGLPRGSYDPKAEFDLRRSP